MKLEHIIRDMFYNSRDSFVSPEQLIKNYVLKYLQALTQRFGL